MVTGGALVVLLSSSAVRRTRHDELSCSSCSPGSMQDSQQGYLSLEQTAWGKEGFSMSADLG